MARDREAGDQRPEKAPERQASKRLKAARRVDRWRGVLIPLLALLIGSLACAGSQAMGTLAADTPATFTLLGEVDYTWRAEVIPERRYTIIVRRVSGNHPPSQLNIHVRDTANRDRSQILEVNPAFSEDTARVSFLAPASGQIAIMVYSKIGMQPENLGPHTLELSAAE